MLRLYTKCKEEGEGTSEHQSHWTKQQRSSNELTSERLKQLKPSKEKKEELEEPSWKDKPLHGMGHGEIEHAAEIK